MGARKGKECVVNYHTTVEDTTVRSLGPHELHIVYLNTLHVFFVVLRHDRGVQPSGVVRRGKTLTLNSRSFLPFFFPLRLDFHFAKTRRQQTIIDKPKLPRETGKRLFLSRWHYPCPLRLPPGL